MGLFTLHNGCVPCSLNYLKSELVSKSRLPISEFSGIITAEKWEKELRCNTHKKCEQAAEKSLRRLYLSQRSICLCIRKYNISHAETNLACWCLWRWKVVNSGAYTGICPVGLYLFWHFSVNALVCNIYHSFRFSRAVANEDDI